MDRNGRTVRPTLSTSQDIVVRGRDDITNRLARHRREGS